MSEDRELRDRIEVLEATVKQLKADDALLRQSLTPPILEDPRREALFFEKFGSLPQPVAAAVYLFVAAVPWCCWLSD